MEYFNLNEKLGVKICIGHAIKGHFVHWKQKGLLKQNKGTYKAELTGSCRSSDGAQRALLGELCCLFSLYDFE